MNQEVYQKLSAPFSQDAIQRTKKEETRKGYDTTGIGYQYCVNRFNEVLGLDGWGYDYSVIKEKEGTFKSGTSFFEMTVEVAIWVGCKDNVRKCVGGHISSSYSDALKGAITNAFKKTAAFWGVGKQAYEGTLDDDAAYEDKVSNYKQTVQTQSNQNAEKTESKQVESKPADNADEKVLMDFYKRAFQSAKTEMAVRATWNEVTKNKKISNQNKSILSSVAKDAMSKVKAVAA